MQIAYRSPECFYPKQQSIYDCDTRFTYTMSANKTGKTFSHAIWINEQCILGPEGTDYAWLAPVFATSEIAFKLLKKLIVQSNLYNKLADENSELQFNFNNSKMRITYPNGNILHFLSGKNVDAIYGKEIHAGVVDEATRLSEAAWDAFLTTFFVTEGPIKLISNQTIKNNWFYKLWDRAMQGLDESGTAFKLTAHDAIEAGIMPQSVFDYAKKHFRPAVFKRDFLAIVPESEVSVFDYEKIYDNIIEDTGNNSLNKVHYAGIDLGFTEGQKSDWTVVIGMDKNGKVRFFKRFKAMGEALTDKLKAYIGNRKAYIDATAGGGQTIYSFLKKDCKNLEPFTISNTSKQVLIETLCHYINGGKIKYPEIKELIDELLAYEVEETATGKTTYNNGKDANHDDTVIALALAVLKLKEEEDKGDLAFDTFF